MRTDPQQGVPMFCDVHSLLYRVVGILFDLQLVPHRWPAASSNARIPATSRFELVFACVGRVHMHTHLIQGRPPALQEDR
eukprot:9230411-Pyramimonas_sp.AAC.1